tara:strand:- start:582 stop:1124 length:543 start_codon:yes stop_codon:yes gene_type:complete
MVTIINRLCKEVFYLDNYTNIINDVDIVKNPNSYFNRYKSIILDIRKYAVLDIKFTSKKIFSTKNNFLGIEIILKNKKLTITFELDGYPFKCPRVIFNNDPDIYCKLYKYNKYFDISECLCSNSIACGTNWSPNFGIANIILEYITNYTKYISRIEDKYNCYLYICYCKLGFYLPIADYL